MIIFKYILRNHLIPFLFSLSTLIAIFLLQFLMKTADKLIGKGLGTWVIIKLIAYNLGWILVLVVPMAVLVATIMAFGSMAQNNEIAIMKASGISMYKMMIPPFLGSILICILLIQFNNNVYPETNHALKYLLRDISRKKPALSLVPGVFSKDIPRFSILAKEIDPLTNDLRNLKIYDRSDPLKVSVVTAKRGNIYFAPDIKKIIMDLYEGEIHQYDVNDKTNYQILNFKSHKILMPGDQFTFEESKAGKTRSDRELGAPQMIKIADSLNILKLSYVDSFKKHITNFTTPDSNRIGLFRSNSFYSLLLKVEDNIKTEERILLSDLNRITNKTKQINEYWVEIHKKYSIPFACIVFVLIGAPLGSMTRKGGFGVAAGLSLVFFVIYWAFLIAGEKLADRALFSPFWGMWSANFVLGIFGIIITVLTAKERRTLDLSFLLKLVPKRFRKLNGNDENT